MKSLLTLALLTVAHPAAAAAQDDEAAAEAAPSAPHEPNDDPRIIGYLRVGFGGEAEAEDGVLGAELDATIGFGVRFEAPLHDYIVLGGLFQASWWEPEFFDDKSAFLDFDVYIAGRFAFQAGPLPMEARITLPVGFTLSLPDSEIATDTGAGWNIGLLFGLQMFLPDSIVGFLFELGWWRHSAHHDFGGANREGHINQGTMSIGVIVLL
jgi:hypothetical protein